MRKISENYRLPYYTLSPTYSVCKDHGYIAGEVYRCPHCGKATEVYSRITGYYRPVQNWNDGKSQEFKDRRPYDIAKSRLTHTGCLSCGAEPDLHDDQISGTTGAAYLFATPTCPNCKAASSLLDANHFAFEKIFANEHPDMAKQYGIRQAPTLVVIVDGSQQKYVGLSEIKRYLEQRAV